MSTDSSGGVQSVAAVNESGLYSLVIGSRKPETQRFRHWVTHKALTAIRRAGRYARAELSPVLAMRPKVTSQHLAACGLQIRNQREEWKPSKAGLHWAEALPCCRGGHSGQQVHWNPSVISVHRELA